MLTWQIKCRVNDTYHQTKCTGFVFARRDYVAGWIPKHNVLVRVAALPNSVTIYNDTGNEHRYKTYHLLVFSATSDILYIYTSFHAQWSHDKSIWASGRKKKKCRIASFVSTMYNVLHNHRHSLLSTATVFSSGPTVYCRNVKHV